MASCISSSFFWNMQKRVGQEDLPVDLTRAEADEPHDTPIDRLRAARKDSQRQATASGEADALPLKERGGGGKREGTRARAFERNSL